MKAEQLDQWKLILETKDWTIQYTRRTHDSGFSVCMKETVISQVPSNDEKTERFPWLFKAE